MFIFPEQVSMTPHRDSTFFVHWRGFVDAKLSFPISMGEHCILIDFSMSFEKSVSPVRDRTNVVNSQLALNLFFNFVHLQEVNCCTDLLLFHLPCSLCVTCELNSVWNADGSAVQIPTRKLHCL
mmetsp:Transcript_5066/g.7338  ORF Transcript_5066/g.7338 Transcript_5066/m.7338 type:complete len:124 (-) Transcript_5066:904-1275(-)